MDNGPFSRVRSESDFRVRNWRFNWFSLSVQPPLKHEIPSQTLRVHVDECCGLATVRWIFRRTQSCTGGDSPIRVLFRKNDFDFQRMWRRLPNGTRLRRRTDLTWPGGGGGRFLCSKYKLKGVTSTNRPCLRFLISTVVFDGRKRDDCPRRKNCTHNFLATYWFGRFFFRP